MKLDEELAQHRVSKDTVLTVGVFDGVHRGHQHLMAQLKAEAERRQALSGVITFISHPRTVLQPDVRVSHLTSFAERIQLLKDTGVDLVIPISFDLELSGLRAREFVGRLKDHLRMRGLVIGPNFALGHRREGDPPALTVLGQEMGFFVQVIVPLHQGDLVVSSTAIRNALAEGDVQKAASMLGRNFVLVGRVCRGAGRGKALGFPTANLEVAHDRAVPGDGVYATWAYVDNTRCKSATSIGVRPTFGSGERSIETYIMDFNGDIYDQDVSLEFAQRLRDELRFDTVEALQAQMARDVEQASSILEDARTQPTDNIPVSSTYRPKVGRVKRQQPPWVRKPIS